MGSNIILQNDDLIAFIKDNSIILKFSDYRNAVTTSWLNGGYFEGLSSIFNNSLSIDDLKFMENHDFGEFLVSKANQLSLDDSSSTGLVTTAKMESYGLSIKKFRKLEVISIVTAGVRYNGASAGDLASFYEENGKYFTLDGDPAPTTGTINTFVIINSNLDENSLISAMMTAIEAKAVALRNLVVPSFYSEELATGTGTDGISVISKRDSDNVVDNAGKHSKLGQLIAESVIEAINISLSKGMYITPNTQNHVLVRLDRLKFNINEFYNDLGLNSEESTIEKIEFIKELAKASWNPVNVAVTSSILNILDEVRHGLMDSEVGFSVGNSIIDSSIFGQDNDSVKKLLKFCLRFYLL